MNGIKWYNSSSASIMGELDLGKHFLANSIRVELSQHHYHRVKLVIQVSYDKQRWSKCVECGVSSKHEIVAHFPIMALRFIHMLQVHERYEFGVVKILSFSCTCKADKIILAHGESLGAADGARTTTNDLITGLHYTLPPGQWGFCHARGDGAN
uniref:F5/8 type C domain-containing protein n=1 Tax=Anopheles quadriannulatus TaxID=34691 RepID=A0A182X4S2_ANOQN